MATTLHPADDLAPAIDRVGRRLAAALPSGRTPKALAERAVMGRLMDDPALRAAIFRFVDVRPACRDERDVARHLAELLAQAEGSPLGQRGARMATRRTTRAATAGVAALGVRGMAHRFIVGEDAASSVPGVERLWRSGAAATVDLLGETTVTEAEADSYAARCAETLRTLQAAAARWPSQPLLERDAAGPIPRVNLSVKVSALTPHLHPNDPERGIAGAADRLRGLLRVARDTGAHLHVDMESFDTREAITELTLRLLSEPEFRAGPSAGIVLQGYLVESPDHLERLLDWAQARDAEQPFTIRLVKGAYWDHEMIEAARHGWSSPVIDGRRACDRNYEALSRRLIDATATGKVRAAIASHNLRSIAHAAAYADARGADIEFQVLRGLGDDTLQALVADGRRVRCYCPLGDIVAGMSYLVRRLLENTSNDSFLSAQASGADIDTLLEAP